MSRSTRFYPFALALTGLLIAIVVGAFASSDSFAASFDSAQFGAGPLSAFPLAHDYDAVCSFDTHGAFGADALAVSGKAASRLALYGLESTPPIAKLVAADATVGTADAASSGGVQIFRAVGPEEAGDIAASGAYRTVPGLEGKYFFPSQEQAENIARMFTERGMGGPYTITSGTIPEDVLARGIPISNAGEGPGYFLQEELLQYINNITMHGPPG